MVKKAIVRVTGRGEPGEVITLQRQLKSAFKNSHIQVRASKKHRRIEISNASREEIQAALSHTQIKYDVKYEEEDEEQRAVVPKDYEQLVTRLERQREQIQRQKGEISELENKLADLQRMREREIKAYKARIRDLETRTSQPSEVQDFLSETVLRESKLWQNFAQFYTETLDAGNEVYGISREKLERGVLDYVPLDKREDYLRIREEFEKAREAKEMSKGNPYIKLDSKAEEIINRVNEMVEEDRQVSEIRGDLIRHAEGKRTRIAITTAQDETLVTLPYQFKGRNIEKYPLLEQPLLRDITEFLESSGLDYRVENFQGVVRYRVNNMGKRLRNRLIGNISSGEDAFTKLGGKREVVRLEIL